MSAGYKFEKITEAEKVMRVVCVGACSGAVFGGAITPDFSAQGVTPDFSALPIHSKNSLEFAFFPFVL